MSRRPSPWQTPFAFRTYLAGAFWAVGAVISRVTETPDQAGWLAIRLDAAGIFYLAASLVGGSNFFAAGFRAARTLKLDMNFLMSAAVVGATLIGEPFEAATLAFLFSLAELLERYAVDRGRRSIEELIRLAPERADRLNPDGTVVSVPVTDLHVGDRVRIRPGDKVPADGRVVTGATTVNEATITGESLPRAKSHGDQVFAGTLNAEGAIDVEVTADAAHSTLARIVQLVREGESRRAPIEQFVKRFARVYTPVITGAAVLIMVTPPLLFDAPGLDWFVRGLTLLVIACPCALVIATPVTVVSALTSAARHGVLIKGGEHLETLGAVRALAIDKTGTLTTGDLTVTSFVVHGADGDGLLRRAAAVEQRSEHPLARAISAYAAARGVTTSATVDDFAAVPGRGVRARVDGQTIAVGTEEFTGPVKAPEAYDDQAGVIRIYARQEDGLGGIFSIRDRPRPAARVVVEQLHRLGIRPVVMLSGDSAATARVVGADTGVDEVKAPLLPEQKVAEVRSLRDRYGSVAMLGDGVNDAPALAEATVGIAMGAAGSAATIETADVALMADDLTRLPYAIRLARRARRIIRFNIGLALLLKAALAVGAVTGTVSLAVAVLLGDMGGSLAVTINSLRLARTKDTEG